MKFFKKFVKTTKNLWFYFTNKVRKNCGDYIASDVQQEINFYVQKVANDPQRAEILNQHVWSKEFRLWMIQSNHCFDLYPQASTEEEVRALLNHEGAKPDIHNMVSVLKANTPSKTLLESLNYESDYIQKLVIAIPSAFSLVPFNKIQDHEVLLRAMIDWAKKRSHYDLLNDYLRYLVNSKTKFDNLVLYAVQQSINGEVIAELLPVIKEAYPITYIWIRENHHKIAKISKLVEKAFIPQNLPNGISDIDNIRIEGVIGDEADTLAWFKIVCLLKCNVTHDILLKNLDIIKEKVTEEVFLQLCLVMVECGHAGCNLISKVPPVVAMRIVNKHSNDTTALRGYLPFDKWPKEVAQKAVKILLEKDRLYYNDLATLSDDLRAYALKRMEIKAQIKVIEKGTIGDIQALYSQKLPEEVEYVVAQSGFYEFRNDEGALQRARMTLAMEYLAKNSVAPAAFNHFIERLPFEEVRKFLSQKRTLSKQEYEVLLLSSRNILAQLVKVKE